MKAALKYRKPDPVAANSDSMSEDDAPLGVGAGSQLNGISNGKTPLKATPNGVNGHARVVNDDAMSEDDKPLHAPAGRKRKAALSSDDDQPLASSSPTKPTRAAPAGSRNSRVSKVSYKEESSDDEVPLYSQSSLTMSPSSATTHTPTPKPPARKRARRVSKEESDAGSEDDMPLSSTISSPLKQSTTAPQSESDDDDEEDSESPRPVAKKLKKAGSKSGSSKKAKTNGASRKSKVKEDDLKVENGLDESVSAKKTRKSKEKEKTAASPKKKAKKEEEEEEIDKWWERLDAATNGIDGEGVVPSAEDVHGDGSVKWNTLVHNGVLFPPPYSPVPENIKFYYAGKPCELPVESEEVAYFFAKLLDTQHAQDPVFQKNFFRDFLTVLKKFPPRDGTKITDFDKCDFRRLCDYINSEKEKKKAWSKEQKKAEKERLLKEEEPYRTCLLDGRKEKVGNFRVEPPGLFLGRGEHPKKGSLKFRLRPEDISINIGKDAPIPVPNTPGKWKAVTHDGTVTWLANWKENINGAFKYVFLAASSSLKGQSDMNKFEKARELKKYVEKIRQDYQVDLRSKMMADRQRATAMYFIDKLALRAGNEKGEDEADTVGCCSLRCEHVTMDPPNKLVFDFLGKDSIRYYNTVEVDVQVFKNIRIFKENKEDDDALFDRVTTAGLNKHLQNYMKGLTAKVFRTYNASITLQQQLDNNTPEDASVMEKLAAYNKANRMVAVLCNHQRAVSKGHGDSMAKMSDKLKGLKYDRMKLRHALFKQEPKMKKVVKYADLESDLDDDFIERWEENLREKDIEKAKKKFAKENQALEADGKKPQKDDILDEIIKGIDEEYKRLLKERNTDKAELKRNKPTEKIEEAIETLDTKIKNFKIQMDDKEEGKQVSLGTSKINYLDPRITAAWCAKHEVPISKIFSKSLLTKFPWALGVNEDWKF